MWRSVSGGITRFSVPITAQIGRAFQAAGPDGVVLALRVMGRWSAAMSQRVGLWGVLGEGVVHGVGLEERLGVALRRARVADEVEDGLSLSGLSDISRADSAYRRAAPGPTGEVRGRRGYQGMSPRIVAFITVCSSGLYPPVSWLRKSTTSARAWARLSETPAGAGFPSITA